MIANWKDGFDQWISQKLNLTPFNDYRLHISKYDKYTIWWKVLDVKDLFATKIEKSPLPTAKFLVRKDGAFNCEIWP